MGLLTDIKKKWNAAPSSGLDGRGPRSTSVPRGRSTDASRTQRQPRPQGLAVGTDGSQDSGVVIVHKDSVQTLTSVPDHGCPNCAAAAAAAAVPARSVAPRPSMDRMKSFSGSRQQALPYQGHVHEHTGRERSLSRPGTGYSSQSGVPSTQAQQHHHHQHHDPGFKSRPLSWGRRATAEDVNHDVPSGYTRPVTPPYSIRSEQTGWNSGQQYNNMYGQGAPGPASHDGDFSQRPTSWRRATSSHLNYDSDPRQPRHQAHGSQSSRAPSEAGSNHPRNASKNMENTAYEAGYRDGKYPSSSYHTLLVNADLLSFIAIARLRADAERW